MGVGGGERGKLGPLADQYLDRDMRSLEQRGNEGWGEGWNGSTCGSIIGSGCWVVLAVLGRSLVELSSTLGVRLKTRRPLFTVKNWAADKKPCKVMSAGCTTCNIYNRHTQYFHRHCRGVNSLGSSFCCSIRLLVSREVDVRWDPLKANFRTAGDQLVGSCRDLTYEILPCVLGVGLDGCQRRLGVTADNNRRREWLVSRWCVAGPSR